MPLMEKEIYEFGPFLLDPAERLLSSEGIPVSLTPKAFETLVYLVRNQGRMLTKDELLKQIWPDTFVEEVNLAVNISTVRKALGENPQDCRFIATIPGHGYRFVALVRKIASQSEDSGYTTTQGPPELLEEASGAEVLKNEVETAGEATRSRTGIGAVLHSGAKGGVLKVAIAAVPVLLLTALLGLHFWRSPNRKVGTLAKAPSIAVLPFADLSTGKDQEYISDGLAEELINDLAQVPGLRVVGRSSSFRFKGKNEDLRTVGRKLGVANILEGSIRREGDRVRIRAELIKADDGFELWSETYDRKMGDIFSVEDEIARAATDALQIKLMGAENAARATNERSANPQAYVAFLHARYFTTRGRDKADLDNALAYVEEAIKLDEKYARAWALRSYIQDTMADVGLMDPATGFRKAREDAERAIELDSNGAGGYLALAWAQINRDWNWEGAELSLKKASELEPGSAGILRYRSFLCESLGQLNEAIDFHKQAIALDPLFASSQSYLAYRLYSAGEYEEAESAAKKALELNPQKTYDHFTLGEILLAQGHAQAALTEMEREPSVSWSLTGKALPITISVVSRIPTLF
jgi:TolB-like protein/DNA-binding winged helix-turn-helix (wHTH) protein/Tfp pilus assembly protein PilF